MAPMVTSAWYDEGWTYEGGALQLGFAMPWALLMAASDPRADPAALAQRAELASDFDALYSHTLGDHPVRDAFPAFAEWLAVDPRPTWRPVAVAKAFKHIDVPAFHVAGWFDLFCDGSLRAWKGLATAAPSSATGWSAHRRRTVDARRSVRRRDSGDGVRSDLGTGGRCPG